MKKQNKPRVDIGMSPDIEKELREALWRRFSGSFVEGFHKGFHKEQEKAKTTPVSVVVLEIENGYMVFPNENASLNKGKFVEKGGDIGETVKRVFAKLHPRSDPDGSLH